MTLGRPTPMRIWLGSGAGAVTWHRLLMSIAIGCGIAPVGSAQRGEAAAAVAKDAATGTEWVTVVPPEFPDAINNPLKGYRAYKQHGYGLLERKYIPWNVIELSADDTVERIIAHTNEITKSGGRRFEDLNVKLVPRVYLDWDGSAGTPQNPKQHWPADLAEFDYDSPAFQARLTALIAKLGKAWDEDPRILAVQMGLIGRWGEHHHPAPTADQRQLLTVAFKKAFKHKPVLVRHSDPEFMAAGFGIYYDTFASLTREPPTKEEGQYPWQATYVYPAIWQHAPIEGEVEYNWQQHRQHTNPTGTFGRTPDETMKVPAYRNYMIDKVRRYHASYLGWISNYDAADPAVLAGAAELQKAFGYRLVLDSVSYPHTVNPGGELAVKLAVQNTGSAPFYLDWPVAVGLLDPATRKPVWSAPLNGVDLRKWLPGEDWDSEAFTYRRPAKHHAATGTATLPRDLRVGSYILALAILDRQGGMVPSARFATGNYFRGGWHPFGYIGIGKAPQEVALTGILFDSPAFDASLSYQVGEALRAIQAPPVPKVKGIPRWSPNPEQELINPWRYWTLEADRKTLAKQSRMDGPAGPRVIRVTGDFGKRSHLEYTLSNDGKLDRGRYRFECRVRGTSDLAVAFEVADGWRGIAQKTPLPLSAEWQQRTIEFDIDRPFKEETRLRFVLPQNAKGEFELTDTRLRKVGGVSAQK